ncbi:MAG: TadE/TadG family type IV pilus assembly protein, partial [Pseudomonadota bacterium]
MRKLNGLFSNRRGNIAAPGAIFFVVLMVVVGGTLDLMSVSHQKAALQDLADNAALASVNELAVTSEDVERVRAVAQAFVERSDLNIISVDADVNSDLREVTVTIAAEPKTNFPKTMANLEEMDVSATARLSGRGGNICMIGLSPSAMSTLRLRSRSQITAESCAIYSNSVSTSSMWVASTALVTADLICVAGGYQGGTDEMASSTLEDCTPVNDPLSMRATPDFETCDHTNTIVTSSQNLDPGVYCGGLIVDG